jgi:hypothetical protein
LISRSAPEKEECMISFEVLEARRIIHRTTTSMANKKLEECEREYEVAANNVYVLMLAIG